MEGGSGVATEVFGQRLPGGVFLRNFDKGTLLIIIGVICLGSNTPFAKLAYRHGMTVTTLLLVRYSLTVLILGALLRLRSIPLIQPPTVSRGALVSAVFLVGTSFGYLGSIQLLPLSLAVLILYTMAAWTVLFGHLFGMERLTPGKALAALLAVTGVGLSVGADFSRIAPLGLGLALGGSVCYSLVATAGKRASRLADPMLVNVYAAFLGAPAALSIGSLLGNLVMPTDPRVWGSTLTSSLLYILGFSLVLAGIQQTAPSRAGVTMTLEPLVTVLISIVMLGEPFTPAMAVGATLVLGAVILVAVQRSAAVRGQDPEVSSRAGGG